MMQWWVLQRYRTYARCCLLGAVFLTPLTIHLGLGDHHQLPKLSVLWFLGVLAGGLLISWSAERRMWFPRSRLTHATGAFVGACAVATALSEAPWISLMGIERRYGGLLPILLYVALALVVVGVYWERPFEVVQVAWASVLASAVVSLYVLVQAAGLDPLGWVNRVSGGDPEFPSATLGNSNFAGGYLSIVLPLAVYLAFTTVGRKRQPVLGAIVALDALALWYTHTRGGLIAAVAGLIALSLVGYGFTRRTRVLGATAAGLVTAVALLVLVQRDSSGVGSLTESSRLRTSTVESRYHSWTAAGRVFLNHPVIGTGLDTFYANYPLHRLARDGAKSGRSLADKPHNILLEHATNAGILGLGSYLLVLGLAFKYALRRRLVLEGNSRLLLAAFVGSLVAYLVQGFFSIDVPPLAVMGWFVLGCIAVIADPALVAARDRAAVQSTEATPSEEVATVPPPLAAPGRPMRWPTHVAVGSAVLVLMLLGSLPMRAAAAANEGRLDEARKLNPLQAGHAELEGDHALLRATATRDPVDKRQLYEEAISDYQAALRLRPNDLTCLVKIASVNTSWSESLNPGRFGEAQRWWRQALDRDPTSQFLRDSHRRAVDTVKAAVTRMEASALSQPDNVSRWIAVARAHLAVEQPERAQAAVERAVALDPSNREARALAATIPR